MGESDGASQLQAGLTRALGRAGMGAPGGLARLTGGATMESWRFEADREPFVLRRAPSLSFLEDRPFGHDTEAALIRAAGGAGVRAPDVVVELQGEDGIGSGFIMRALPGTPDPRAIQRMDKPERLLAECAAQLADIHGIARKDVPADVPVMNYGEAIAKLREQFEEAGGDRPILALSLKWLQDNCPAPVEPVLNHGDFRLGNLLVEEGRLTGVLDWELAHFGDWHEDLAFGCMPVWRFGAYERPALGLGSLEDYFAAYEAAGGRPVDRARFRFWTIYRMVWWALGCLRNAQMWRSGDDRMLERVVISRRTSEQELDLLLLLEEEAPEAERTAPVTAPYAAWPGHGEATSGEIARAVSEWLGTIKARMEGHDRFQLAVARNALGMIARDDSLLPRTMNLDLAAALLAGDASLDSAGLLATLRADALEKLEADVPKYPALAVARRKWLGEN
ncbi:phosphotransferase [Erythrobacter vulgaris]|uniref:Phosphotransferase n=1 Tax=Qipengyuania vulgaris TaxID=291985 RepID=A0A844XTC5_9SPHN|nr:phosphotransferase family protein [Qipengyuania vulgaris]MXO48252.1 phosphotransferase [Qipengyuania vulgaris]